MAVWYRQCEWTSEGEQKCIKTQSMGDGERRSVTKSQHMKVCQRKRARVVHAPSRVVPQDYGRSCPSNAEMHGWDFFMKAIAKCVASAYGFHYSTGDKMPDKKRIIIGMSGASGAVLGVELLKAFGQQENWETHLVVSHGAEKTLELETGLTLSQTAALADFHYDIHERSAAIASGSFRTEGMIIAPCSMKTVAGIACGYAENLLLRSADVCLKERRKLVLVARETPLNPVHLKNMLELATYGAVILPPVMSFYGRPETIEDMISHIVGKTLMQFGLDWPGLRPWSGEG